MNLNVNHTYLQDILTYESEDDIEVTLPMMVFKRLRTTLLLSNWLTCFRFVVLQWQNKYPFDLK